MKPKTYKREFGFACAAVAFLTAAYVLNTIAQAPADLHTALVGFGTTVFLTCIGVCMSCLGLDWVGKQSPWAKPPGDGSADGPR